MNNNMRQRECQTFHKIRLLNQDKSAGIKITRGSLLSSDTMSVKERRINDMDGITTSSCLSASGAILDKPVVKKSGLELHECIKQNITRRAKSASLILGQRRMTAEPFLLKCQRLKSANMHLKGTRSCPAATPDITVTADTRQQQQQPSIRQLTIVLPNPHILSSDSESEGDENPAGNSLKLQDSSAMLAVRRLQQHTPTRLISKTSGCQRQRTKSEGTGRNSRINTTAELLTVIPLINDTPERGKSEESIFLPNKPELTTSKSYTGYHLPIFDTMTLPPAPQPLQQAGSSLPHWRSKSARLYLRAPALRPLICAEEGSKCMDCTEAGGTDHEDCSGDFRACLASTEYLDKKM